MIESGLFCSGKRLKGDVTCEEYGRRLGDNTWSKQGTHPSNFLNLKLQTLLRSGIGEAMQNSRKGSLRTEPCSGSGVTVKANPAGFHRRENSGLRLWKFPHAYCWERNEQ